MSGVIYLIGNEFMMQMSILNSGIDSDSGAHFCSESVLRFIYFNKTQHIVLVKGDC